MNDISPKPNTENKGLLEGFLDQLEKSNGTKKADEYLKDIGAYTQENFDRLKKAAENSPRLNALLNKFGMAKDTIFDTASKVGEDLSQGMAKIDQQNDGMFSKNRFGILAGLGALAVSMFMGMGAMGLLIAAVAAFVGHKFGDEAVAQQENAQVTPTEAEAQATAQAKIDEPSKNQEKIKGLAAGSQETVKYPSADVGGKPLSAPAQTPASKPAQEESRSAG